VGLCGSFIWLLRRNQTVGNSHGEQLREHHAKDASTLFGSLVGSALGLPIGLLGARGYGLMARKLTLQPLHGLAFRSYSLPKSI
jgi:hypothetical protein